MLHNAINSLHDQTSVVFDQLNALDTNHQLAAFTGSGVSRHLRHMHDHERAVQDSLSSGVVNYNKRHRSDPGEQDFQIALTTSQQLRQAWLSADLSDRPVEVRSEISVTDHQTLVLQSTLWREVMYVIHHNIHHLAYIKLLLEQKGIRLPDTIGQAPATASYFRALEVANV
ncbi:DinB family protein [Saccharospirillum impatiens]|uniref:DinB family protein n=1 Tax=Saccharospirillum impatiens TaxID=169438 RepID=UPI0004157247|nr:DinB family protein [Saccharospirillum impatiens]